MANWDVRPIEQGDFATLMRLEDEIFGGAGESVLGPYYLRLCCEFYSDTCFIAYSGDRAVGYLLSFVRDREVYCTTLAAVPELQGSRLVYRLIQAFTAAVLPRADTCWFTVAPDNLSARRLHAALGATEIGRRKDFYGPGDERIVSRIDRDSLARLRSRYTKLGLLSEEIARPMITRLGAVDIAASVGDAA
jgi:ribosomal protein S18 acetylase RimI-like enzyme